jgi:hypothetical protein
LTQECFWFTRPGEVILARQKLQITSVLLLNPSGRLVDEGRRRVYPAFTTTAVLLWLLARGSDAREIVRWLVAVR